MSNINIPKELKKSISKLSVYDLSVYTAIELYYKLADKLNEVIDLNDETVKSVVSYINDMKEYLNTLVFDDIDDLLKRQDILEKSLSEIISEAGNSNTEIVASRVDSDGKTFDTLPLRLQDTDSKIKQKVDKSELLQPNNLGELSIALFFDGDEKTQTFLFSSTDGKTFNKLSDKPIGNFRDCDIMFYNNKFYVVATQNTNDISDFILLTSSDLISWTKTKIDVGLRSGSNQSVYAPEFFKDTNGDIYIILSKQVGTMVDSITSNTFKNFRPYIVKINNLETFSFDTPKEIILDDNNKIDGHIIKKGIYYYLFIKKERNEGDKEDGSIEIWKSTDLNNWSNVTYKIPIGGKFEAPSVEFINGQYYLYVDNYANDLDSYYYYATSSDLENWSTFKRIECNYPTRHASVRKLKDYNSKQVLINAISKSYISNNTPSLNLYNKHIIIHNNTSFILNKSIKILEFDFIANYKSCCLELSIFDSQNNTFGCELSIIAHRKSNKSNIDLTFNVSNITNDNYNFDNFVLINNNGTIELYLKVSGYGGMTPTLNIKRFSHYLSELRITKQVVDVIPNSAYIYPRTETIKTILHENTSLIQNKLIEILNINCNTSYKSCYLEFNISDTQNNFFNADFSLMVRRGSSEDDITIDYRLLKENVRGFDYRKIKVIQEKSIVRVVFDVGSTSSSTPTLCIKQLSNFVFSIKTPKTIYESLTTGNIHNYTQNLKRESKYYDVGNSKTIKLNAYIKNGLIEIKGQTNDIALNRIINYGIGVLNGKIQGYPLTTGTSNITVALDSHNNGGYEITITLPYTYSTVEILLPCGSYFK